MKRIRSLHLPIGTRVIAVTQHVSDHGITWRVWTGIANIQVPPEKYMGHYLELLPDGSIRQCSTDMSEYEVMEKLR